MEEADEDENDTIHNIQPYCAPYEFANTVAREYAQVEEQQRCLEDSQLREIQDFHDVEGVDESGDLSERYGPDVPTETIGCECLRCDDRAWSAKKEKENN